MGGAPETAAWALAVTPATLSIQPARHRLWTGAVFLKERGGRQWRSVLKSASEASAAVPAVELGCSGRFQPIEGTRSCSFTTKYMSN